MNRKLACCTLALSGLLASSSFALAPDSVGGLNWCPDTQDCLLWSPSTGAVQYNLYRGDGLQLPGLLGAGSDSCTVGTYSATTTGAFADVAPGPGDLRWYLIGAIDELGAENAGQASAGPRTVDTSGECQAAAKLAINEVDYDQAGSDVAEFVEIYNAGPGPADLTGIVLILVNGGTQSEYRRVQLSDAASSLAAGGFLVVGAPDVQTALPAGTPFTAFAAASNNVQNGSPDAIALFDTGSEALLDALSYEGSVIGATLEGADGTYDLVEGNPTPVADSNSMDGSMGRFPDGRDTGDAASDWFFIGVVSPGAPNPVP